MSYYNQQQPPVGVPPPQGRPLNTLTRDRGPLPSCFPPSFLLARFPDFSWGVFLRVIRRKEICGRFCRGWGLLLIS
ncbi:hypothetical protein NL676_017433 [Syzygium grande]|nr:hypothetical protein NL676_017433 [Syzygium grande]